MDKYPSLEEIKELKRKRDIVFSEDFKYGHEALASKYILPKLKKIHQKNSTSFLMFSAIFSLDKDKQSDFIDDLQIFCWENEVSVIGAIYFLMGWDQAEIDRIKRLNISLINNDEINYFNQHSYDDKNSFAKKLYLKVIEIYESIDKEHDISKYPKTFKRILENSFELIKKNTIKNIKEVLLPLEQYNIDSKKVVDEIEDMKYFTSERFNSNYTLSKIQHGSHYLSWLKNDSIEITDDYQLIFSGLTSGFSIGYTDKAILISLDKRSTIFELKSNLKILEKYKKHSQADTNELIDLTKHLIEFIDQNKAHVNYIPYKAIAKKMGISKNKVKRYAKEFRGINEKTFLENFDTLKTYTLQ